MTSFLANLSGNSSPRRAPYGLAAVLLLAGCTGLPAPETVSPNIYVLEAQPAIKVAPARRNLVLAISTPRARPGFDTAQIAYVKQAHELNYFVTSRWAAPPARMLEPLLLQALGQTESFRAVVPTAGAVAADVVLDVELVKLQHNFQTRPSQAQLTLRAQLIDVHGKRALAVKQFDETENAASDDAYGGVTAANRLVQRVLGQLADFCISESAVQ
jgi:cholesterol transport system auxiliary component